MHQHFTIPPEETVRAKWPHEIFLINLVFNHILVFASTFGVFSTFPLMVLIVPITSFAITGYIIIKANKSPKATRPGSSNRTGRLPPSATTILWACWPLPASLSVAAFCSRK